MYCFNSNFCAIMPYKLQRLIDAASIGRFDNMIGYSYAMAIISSIVQRYAKLQIGTSYNSELCLYFLTIAQSGSGKGTMFNHLFNHLNSLIEEKKAKVNHENELRSYRNNAIQTIIQEKKKQSRKYSGRALDVIIDEIINLERQILKLTPVYEFVQQDVTTASLLTTLADQPEHSLLIADTEGRFIRSLDEDKALSALLNQTFVGESISNSRVKNNKFVTNPRLSITVAIQPDKLLRITRNKHLWSEGFMARTLPYYASPIVQSRVPISEITDTEILKWWKQKLEYLFKLSFQIDENRRSQPIIINLNRYAKEMLEYHTQQLQDMILMPQYARMEANLSRLGNITARLATIYHFIEHHSPLDAPVSGEMMDYAINACYFFLEHIRHLRDDFNPDPMWALLPKVCNWLLSHEGTKNYVTLKEIYHGIGNNKTGIYRVVDFLQQNGILINTHNIEHDPNVPSRIHIKDEFFINFLKLRSHNF